MPDEPEMRDVKIAALLSVPMVGWNPHWGCVESALRPFGIPLRLGYGAYWHQTMQNLLEECCNDGLDWALTLDYDTMFTANDLNGLIGRFGRNPEMDALCALQCKRGEDDCPLASVGDSTSIEIGPGAVEVKTAHFGMTLFRLDALRQVPMPWLLGVPNENGSYKSTAAGRKDADIYFWHHFRAHGKRAFMDPHVPIGHLMAMVACYDEHLKVKYEHVTKWRREHRL